MKLKYMKVAVMGLAAIMTMNSCRETIDEGERFTFLGKTVAAYLEDDENCSHFVEILTRGECIGLMKAYGTYTCFAPTNASIEKFLQEQYTIWKTSYDDPELKTIETGIHHPSLDSLSKEKCVEIARNHIIPKVYLGVNLRGNIIPDANINDRDLTLMFDTINKKTYPVINKQARVIKEEEVENGVVHIVEGVVNPSSYDMPTLLGEYPYFDIFSEALERTGYAAMLTEPEDPLYADGDKYGEGVDQGSNIPYPANKRYGFTMFLVTDETLKEKYGIETFDDLKDKCKTWYKDGEKVWAYNSDPKVEDWEETTIDYNAPLTSPRNPVNQFVGYHLLDRKLAYEYLVFHNVKSGTSYDSEDDFPDNADRTEYYVTMNNRILKVTKPLSERDYTIYLNYAAKARDEDYLNVKVWRPNDFTESNPEYKGFVQEALNGSLNVIDDVLIYKETLMEGYVLNCIMRFDFAGLCPELTNNKIRWKYLHSLTSQAEVFIPDGYCRDVKINSENTRLLYLPPHSNWGDYQGDEMMAKGVYDFEYRLPPVPAGTYEIRMGYTAEAGMRGIVQVYVDGEVTGIPITLDMAGTDAKIGWKQDEADNEEQHLTVDKEMKNRGFLKGPKSFKGYAKDNTARDEARCLRAVIATKQLWAGTHWIRFKDVDQLSAGNKEFMHDYLEIVPIGYLNSPEVTEDEKRY